MTFEISYEAKTKLHVPYREIIEKSILLALDYEKCPYEAEVSVTIVDDEEIREINKEHRNIDKATDVLSFPFNEFDTPGDFTDFDDIGEFNPDTGELLLGDIVLSANHIIAQANEYGHTRKRELAFLVVHSMLHLMGYDHMEEEERKIMEQRQEEILQQGGYVRF